jgi:hypothetical protein
MRRLIRPLTALGFALGLWLLPATSRAQGANETWVAPEEEKPSEGDPVFAYIGTGLLASGAIFGVCKSARR